MTTTKNVPAEDERRNQLRADCRELAERLRAAAAVALEDADRIAEYAATDDLNPAWGYFEYVCALEHLASAATGVPAPYEMLGHERLSSAQKAAAAAAFVLQIAADLNGPSRNDPQLSAVALDLFRRANSARPDSKNPTPDVAVLEIVEYESRVEAASGPRTDEDIRWMITQVMEFAEPDVAPPTIGQARAAVDAWGGRGTQKKWEALNEFLRFLGFEPSSAAALEQKWHRCRSKRLPGGASAELISLLKVAAQTED